MAKIAGLFNFETVLCQMFGLDIGDGFVGEDAFELLDMTLLDKISALASQWKDVSPLATIIESLLGPDAAQKLGHERMHYWQLLACPQQQWTFLLKLRIIENAVAEKDGNLLALVKPFMVGGIDDVENTKALADSEFGDVLISEEDVALDNHMPFPGISGLAGLPLVHYRTAISDVFLAGFAGKMLDRKTGKEAYVPFTGIYLLESAARISEMLESGEEIPLSNELGNPLANRYFAVWEYWSRLLRDQYSSTRELAYAFLAAVDLCLHYCPMNFGVRRESGDFSDSSLPFRFGRLLMRAIGKVRPLSLEGTSPDLAVARFQVELASAAGWIHPTLASWYMARNISRVLLTQLSPTDNLKAVVRRWAELLASAGDLPLSVFEIADRSNFVWEAINESRDIEPDIAPPLGFETLGSMLNACVFRVQFPGQFALPHVYRQRLLSSFPMPAVLSNGRLHRDSSGGAPDFAPLPYRHRGNDLAHDTLGLVCLTAKDKYAGCGFLDERIICWYVKAGLACPVRGYSQNELEARNSRNLKDWCHHKRWTVKLGLADPESLRYWTERLEKGA